ncbi:MAG: outer membrane beta-barrel protein [Gammaproteobacteria bacterium]|nr:outer membrane beta-barrel protein [Gammaproteobacteria bacterium]MDH3430022.1 outer membrane beta-barrel protein [Gammaproteobacteria bacterium]MDH3434861.1 outer membrane beta-barrel protein [Gammaproteobacteria bacterium]
MFRKILLIALVAGCCGAASAAEPKEKGFYIGAAGGTSLYDDDGAFSFAGFDDDDNSRQLHAGYKIFPYVAVEVRHVDFGTYSLGFLGSSLDFTATSVHAVGMFPFGASGWEIFGQIGLGDLNVDIQGAGSIDDGGVVSGGFGVRYHATKGLSIGVQADVYVWEDSAIYDMGVGSTQLSINYIF